MTRRQYPLEALRKLREARAEADAKLLAAQVALRQTAEANLRHREQARREHQRTFDLTKRMELERLSRGELAGADLQRQGEFELAVRAQLQALAQVEAAARAALSSEHEKEAALRQQLAKSEAEAQLVRKHEQGFSTQQAELTLLAEEEAALEQWNARRH